MASSYRQCIRVRGKIGVYTTTNKQPVFFAQYICYPPHKFRLYNIFDFSTSLLYYKLCGDINCYFKPSSSGLKRYFTIYNHFLVLSCLIYATILSHCLLFVKWLEKYSVANLHSTSAKVLCRWYFITTYSLSCFI